MSAAALILLQLNCAIETSVMHDLDQHLREPNISKGGSTTYAKRNEATLLALK